MTDTLERVISTSGSFFAIAVTTTHLVNEALRCHDPGPTAAAALGRALTGTVLLAGLLKDGQKIQLIFEGNGPLGKIVSEADCNGNCRGYVANPYADVPLKDGRIDVATGLGKAGFLRVTKDIGMGKENYTGMVQLYTSEIADDIAFYLTESEQTPSTVGIGVSLLPDGTVSTAGGFLIQSLPPADEKIIATLEKGVKSLGSITEVLTSGSSPGYFLSRLFADIPHRHTGSSAIRFSCSCSKEKMGEVLATLNEDDINYLFEESDEISMKCEYCASSYTFDKTEMQNRTN